MDAQQFFVKKYGGKKVGGKVQDANFFIKEATYDLGKGKAYIALKNTSGLATTMIKDPAFTTSYGLGQQIAQAIKLGVIDVIIELLYGSTNDGGAGAAAALGAEFYNEEGEIFVPTGGTLEKIKRVNVEPLKEKIKGVRFTALCEDNIPLCGEEGCSLSTSEAKGAKTEEQRNELERNMQAFAKVTEFLGCEADGNFMGNEGGLGYFVQAFLGGKAKEYDRYGRE